MKSYPLRLHLPEFWGRKWKGQSCTEWISQPIPPPTISFSRVLRWEKDKDRGRKCNLPAAGCMTCCNIAQTIWNPTPLLFKFAGILKRKWKGQSCTEWISQPIPPPTISFSRVLRWEKEKDRGRKCNLPAAGAWHVVNLHKQYEILPPTLKSDGVLR